MYKYIILKFFIQLVISSETPKIQLLFRPCLHADREEVKSGWKSEIFSMFTWDRYENHLSTYCPPFSFFSTVLYGKNSIYKNLSTISPIIDNPEDIVFWIVYGLIEQDAINFDTYPHI
jgi:hypothetical protein